MFRIIFLGFIHKSGVLENKHFEALCQIASQRIMPECWQHWSTPLQSSLSWGRPLERTNLLFYRGQVQLHVSCWRYSLITSEGKHFPHIGWSAGIPCHITHTHSSSVCLWGFNMLAWNMIDLFTLRGVSTLSLWYIPWHFPQMGHSLFVFLLCIYVGWTRTLIFQK